MCDYITKFKQCSLETSLRNTASRRFNRAVVEALAAKKKASANMNDTGLDSFVSYAADSNPFGLAQELNFNPARDELIDSMNKL